MEIVNDGWPVAVNPITERNPSRPYCISQRVCLNISAILKVWGACFNRYYNCKGYLFYMIVR